MLLIYQKVDSADRSLYAQELAFLTNVSPPLLVPEPYGQLLTAYGSLPISSFNVTVNQLARPVTTDGKSVTLNSERFARMACAVVQPKRYLP